MWTGTDIVMKGLWLKLKVYSDDELVKEEDENLTSAAPLGPGTVTSVTPVSRHGLSRSISKNTAE